MADIQKGFETLQQDIGLRYHEKVLVQCRESEAHIVRKSLPEDMDLIKTEIVALINLERYQEALEAIPGGSQFDFERGYVLYKLSKFRDTAEICEGKPDLRFQHLCAQAVSLTQHYKLGNFGRAMQMYQDLSSKGDAVPILVNLSAAGVVPGLSQQMLSHAQLHQSSEWEIAYNKSVALFLSRQYTESLQFLSQASKSLSKEEDTEDESWQIELQRACVFQKLEETQQASEIYQRIIESQVKDPNLRTVAVHNGAILTEKLPNFTEFLKVENKLTVLQQAAVLLNLALIYGKKRKTAEFEECLRQVEELQLGNKAMILRVWSLVKDKKHSEYDQLLRSQGTAESLRLLASIYIQQKKLPEAAGVYQDLVAQVPSDQRTPDLYLTLVGLQDKSGNLSAAVKILETAISVFPNNKSVIRRLWECLHRNNQFSEAAHYLESYQSQFKGDLDTTSLLVLSEANVDLESAQRFAAKLPEVNLKALYNKEGVIESLDQILDRLEAGGAAQVRTKTEDVMNVDQETRTRKKRKRKPRYPKGFDPTNPSNPLPDPERWLAKKDRSSYKKLHKKKDAKMKGPQGEMPQVPGQEQGAFSTGPSTKHIEAVVDKTAPKKKNRKK